MSITFNFMDLEEAAKALGINKITLQRAIKAGELEAVQIGYGYKVTPEALQKWVESKTVNATTQQTA